MNLKPFLAAAAATLALALPALADITVTDAYARSSGPSAKSGAAFLTVENTGDRDDRLILVRSDAAKRVELHTHMDDGNGTMRMAHAEDGFEVPAHSVLTLSRGGKHVMFMGLTTPFTQGAEITLTLVFRDFGEVTLTVPVDLTR